MQISTSSKTFFFSDGYVSVTEVEENNEVSSPMGQSLISSPLRQNLIWNRRFMEFTGQDVTERRTQIDYGDCYVHDELRNNLEQAGLDVEAYLQYLRP